jgi:hypothetical protein
MNEPDRLRAFVCPLCASQQAHRVVVRRHDGRDYTTSFYNCSGCTVMFLDVERFAELIRRVVDSRGSGTA